MYIYHYTPADRGAVTSLGAGATSNDGWRQGRSAASRVIHVYTGVRDTFFAWRYNIGDMQICCRAPVELPIVDNCWLDLFWI